MLWPLSSIVTAKEAAMLRREVKTEEEEEAFLPSSPSPTPKPSESGPRHSIICRASRAACPWIVSTIILAALLIASLVRRSGFGSSRELHSPNLNELSTDIPDARKAIIYERQNYTGELIFDEKTKRVLRVLDAEIQYFGEPSDNIEEAWETMLRYEFPMLYGDEVPETLDEANRYTDEHFHFEPDLFHNLHCLNEIRKQVSKTLYPASTYYQRNASEQELFMQRFGPGWTHDHIEHCMDRLRQALICHGDLTPSVMHRYEGLTFELYHTGERLCRKWEPIREWVDERAQRDDRTREKEADS